jgi:hypothetical protein
MTEPAIHQVSPEDRALIGPLAPNGSEPATDGVLRSVPGSAPAAPQTDARSGKAIDGSGGGETAGGDALQSATDRKIVQSASLRIGVDNVSNSFNDIGRIAAGAGGFVASSNFAHEGKNQVATATIRVPADRYQDVLTSLRGLGKRVESESSNANDVTEQYSDLSARLRTLEATEGQLLQLLGQARNVGEVLQVQDRLNTTRAEIERVKGRMLLLDKLSELATITVQLAPVAAGAASESRSDLVRAIEDAWAESLAFLEDATAAALTVVVFSWWIVALGVPVAWVLSRRARARPRPAASESTTSSLL